MKSARVEVLGCWLQYVEVGVGDPVLFLHGNPTSSYLRRKVIGAVARTGRRSIALHPIGRGGSGKPAIDYRLVDHLSFVEAFIETSGLSPRLSPPTSQ
ncbi:alpha/beta fold hydrolase [Kribbella sp. NPDC051587]|uniref:alpha/beta fold hydrolase n=1 Tax=Kribbella sp. NPDC051587 TaxID=3364119 RepID=UPI0037B93467